MGVLIESQIQLGDLAVEIILKDIKNVYLAVDPRTGRVRISAPRRTSLNTIRAFAKSQLNWIIRQRTKLRDEARETQRGYLDGETPSLWGTRLLLILVEENGFHGFVEVEIFSNRYWTMDQDQFLKKIKDAFLKYT